MKIKLKEDNRDESWHKVFSWLPRIVEDRWMKEHFVWLEYIERRWTWSGHGARMPGGYTYRVKDE